ncbi:MAG: co-chaperone GroES [Bdellovibrionota bacterium]
MAKKKSVKKPAKKVTASKKAKVKAKPAKKAAPVKKAAAKKPAAKKTAPKRSVKKSTPVKKSVKAKPAQKVATKKAAPVKAVTAKVDYTKAITPLGDRLVIRLTKTEKVSPGGLILLDSTAATEGYLKGEVLAAGHGTYTKKGHHKLLDVKIGDTVLFSDYSSTKVKFNNEDLHIVHENEILGVTK